MKRARAFYQGNPPVDRLLHEVDASLSLSFLRAVEELETAIHGRIVVQRHLLRRRGTLEWGYVPPGSPW
jgi:hypothetical protein